MDRTDQDSATAWFRLAVSLVIATVGNVGIWSIIVVLPAVEAEFGLSRAGAAVPYVATMVGFGIGNLILGRIVDRWGVARALTLSGLGLGLFYGGTTLAPNAAVLTLFQGLIGFCCAVCFAPLIADISHWFRRHRGIAVALVASGNYISGAIWPLALAPVLEGGDWRLANLIIAAVILVVLVPAPQFLRRKIGAAALRTAETEAAGRRAAAGLSPRVLQGLLALAGFSCCMAMAMPQVHIVALCVDLGFGAGRGAEMLALMLLGGVVSRLASGALADRIGGLPTLLIGSVLQCVALFLFLPAGTLASLYAVSLVFGLAQGGIVPSYAIVIREFLSPHEAGARTGVVIMATIFGMGVGGWMSGWIYDVTGSYDWAFLHGIGWNALNIAIAVALFLSTKRLRLSASRA
ncbi:MAG: MFS transporter [Pseudomonadota bacterium]